MSSIYQEVIIDHYQHPRNSGQITNPTATVSLSNPLCGDKITMSVIIKNKKIVDLKYQATGCAISVASASLLSEYAVGKKIEDLIKLDRQFSINILGDINLGPNRLKCALLSLEALQKLLIL